MPVRHEHLLQRKRSASGGEGGHDGYEQDPLWYDLGDMIPCDTCRGEGWHHWCPRCGWDMLRPAKCNTPEWRGMAIMKRDTFLNNARAEALREISV